VIRTVLCSLLGIDHPIIQGGMAWVATKELASAVSNAGGLGIIAAGNAPPDLIREQVRGCKTMTDKPYGVNIALFSPHLDDIVQICVDERVPVVTTGAGSPSAVIPPLKEVGAIVLPVIGSVALARRVERMGADAIIAEGMESGGHVGDVATMPLIPQVVDAVSIPVVAAGGIADGRGVAAALALGAAGVQMGTRFICTEECDVHLNYKQRICRASDRSTVTSGHSLGHPVRAIKNQMTQQFQRMERSGLSEQEIIEFGTGRLRMAAVDGDMVDGSIMAGQASGLVCEIVTVQEVMDKVVSETELAIAGLSKLIA
jgi:enoyl-[acyl-carrier protein] reductase II